MTTGGPPRAHDERRIQAEGPSLVPAVEAVGAALSIRDPNGGTLLRRAAAIACAAAAERIVPGAGALFPAGETGPPVPVPAIADAAALASAYEHLLAHRAVAGTDGFALVADRDPRRAAGSFWTPPDVVDRLLDRALRPLLDERGDELLAVRVCDPACGAGTLLAAAGARIAARVAAAGGNPADVARRCLFGVDADAVAAGIARLALVEAGASIATAIDHVRVGDALVGATFGEPPAPAPDALAAFDWTAAFPAAAAAGGFDLVLGNPPWIAHAGRAARPLPDAVRRHHRERYAAFARYPTTHGLFVERATTVVRPGGRVALVLPTSVADLDGYAPTRAAHDARCDPEADLPDLGDGRFGRVFQPAMALVSVRRPGGRRRGSPGAPWPLERPDLDEGEDALLRRLAALPPLPAHLFGERGLQTTAATSGALVAAAGAGPGTVALRTGGDVAAFALGAPSLAIPARHLRPERFRGVALVVRQTARRPIAAAADGQPFRNSLLAGFADDAWPAPLLLALLNSAPVGWHHARRFRDARQGMPQVKIGHLRAIPRPPALDAVRAELEGLGHALAKRNDGVRRHEQARLDGLAADAYALDDAERALVTAAPAGTFRGATP